MKENEKIEAELLADMMEVGEEEDAEMQELYKEDVKIYTMEEIEQIRQ